MRRLPWPHLALAAGLVLVLAGLGGDEAAHEAVQDGNAHYAAGRYAAALDRYALAAGLEPEAAEIAFNRGDALFRQREYERALEHYLAVLGSGDPELAAPARYNIGIVKYRQALAAAQNHQDALSLADSAIRYFRDSLELAPDDEDARYNLELVYRFRHDVEAELLRAQRNQEDPGDRASLRRGQEFTERTRNEGGGERRATPDLQSRPHGQRAHQTPENFSSHQESNQPPKDARLPMAMSAEAAEQLLEELDEQRRAAEVWRQQQRQKNLARNLDPRPW